MLLNIFLKKTLGTESSSDKLAIKKNRMTANQMHAACVISYVA